MTEEEKECREPHLAGLAKFEAVPGRTENFFPHSIKCIEANSKEQLTAAGGGENHPE